MNRKETPPYAPPINPAAAARRIRFTADDFVTGVRSLDRVLLGKAITLLESTRAEDQALAQEILERCLPFTGDALRVGITGAPGVGKSSLIERLGLLLMDRGLRVAVLTTDPSSTRTGGSILGDKTRMPRLALQQNAFIRPSPTAGALGGVTHATRLAMLLCEAAGHDVVLVETVGVGQSEIAARAIVDFVLLLVHAHAGDELQALKRGIMETADAIAVAKADGVNKDRTLQAQRQYCRAIGLFPGNPSEWRPRVLTCSSHTGAGVPEIWATIEAFAAHARASGFLEENRKAQARLDVIRAVEHRLKADFFGHPDIRASLARLQDEAAEGSTTSLAAARRLVELYRASA